MRKVLQSIAKFGRDLFMGVGNRHWELGRILGFLSVAMMVVASVHNMRLGQAIDLGPTGLGGGIAAVLGGAAAMVAAKDWLRTKYSPEERNGDAAPPPTISGE